jgi:hypothetical protein
VPVVVLVERRHVVEVDVGEPVPLLLVELDAGAAPLEARKLPGDGFLERRVLAAVLVDEDEARVPVYTRARPHPGGGRYPPPR